jgi:endonuclease III-like uncharacterized protein
METTYRNKDSQPASLLPTQQVVDELTRQLLEKDTLIHQQQDRIQHDQSQLQIQEERLRHLLYQRYHAKAASDTNAS